MNPYDAPQNTPDQDDILIKRTSYMATFIAMLGILCAMIDALAVMGTIRNGISQSKVVVMSGGDPTQLSAVIGETIIGIGTLSILALLPAVLLYIALGPMRLRTKWFYSCTSIASIVFLVTIPVATVCGIILLVALRRRRREFFNDTSDSKFGPEYFAQDSEHRHPNATAEQVGGCDGEKHHS